MGVGLKGLLLTSHIYPYTQSMVPYSGDKEFCPAWGRPGSGDRLALGHAKFFISPC